MAGLYCHECGEKILVKEDFYISRYISGFISTLTNLDSKFYTTFKAFLGRPGQLSADYLNGRRKPYLTPIQIFLIATILFFVFIQDFDIFYVPAKWFFSYMATENPKFVNQLAMDKMAELGVSRSDLALRYDLSVNNYAKVFLFIAIPFLALGSYLSRPRAVPQFGKHMIFATHNLAFIVFWFFCLLSVAFQLPDWTPKWLMMSLGFGGEYIYFVLANRRTWNDSWFRALVSGFLQLFILTVFLMAYRSGISYATLITL